MHLDENNTVVCAFGNGNVNTAIKSVSPHLYVVGDLAYYGMILGKEGMSGDHCHLCKLAAKEFVQLSTDREPWVHEELKLKGNELTKTSCKWWLDLLKRVMILLVSLDLMMG